MFKYEFWIFTSKHKNYHEYRTYKTEKTSTQLSNIAKKYATKVARKQGTEIVSCGYRYPNNYRYYFARGVSVGA